MQPKLPFFKYIFMASLGTLAALVLYVAPAEKTLGSLVKLVYLHGTTVNTSMVFFFLASSSALFYVILRRDQFIKLSWTWLVTGIVFWSASFSLSLASMRFVWGAIAWGEPRTRAMIFVLLVAAALYFLSTGLHRPLLSAVINLSVFPLVWTALSTASLRLHPLDPVRSSGSRAIQLPYFVLLVILLAMGLLAGLPAGRSISGSTRKQGRAAR